MPNVIKQFFCKVEWSHNEQCSQGVDGEEKIRVTYALCKSKTNLKASWAPVDKLNGSLGLDCRNSCIHILGYHITTVQQTASHVFAVTRVTFNHLIGWLKASIGDFSNTQLLVVGFLSRDNRSIGGQREVDTWVWHQVGLQE